MQELAEGLVGRGYQVTVLTSVPREYLPAPSERTAIQHVDNGVRIIRTKTLPLRNVPFLFRGVSQLLLPFLFIREARRQVRMKIDVVIVYSPPLPLAFVGGWMKRRWGAKFILLLEDLFPQNAIDLGILRRRHAPITWLFREIERHAYRRADLLTFHCDGGRRYLMEQKGVPGEKVVTIPNWVDVRAYQDLPARTGPSFRDQWGLEGKFVLLFGGVIGPAQGVEFVVDVARAVAQLDDIVFLFVGDGMERSKLEARIAVHRLKNILIKPFVSKADYPALVQEMDVGLVCLSSKNTTPFIPGKFLGYMASGKPVLAFLHKESDGFALVERAQCGVATEAGDLAAAVSALKWMRADRTRLREQGKNGRAYAESVLSVDRSLDQFEQLF